MQITRIFVIGTILAAAWILPVAADEGGAKGDGGPATQGAATASDPESLMQQMKAAFAAQDYEKAAQACQQWLKITPRNPFARLELACALARLGHTEEALAALQTAAADGWANPKSITNNDDFKALRDDPRLAAVVAAVQNNLDHPPYEKGEEIAGVKTVEDLPPGGLRYRLRRSPAATAQKPDRLIIWLHPSGGASDDLPVERLAPMFNQHGFALVVFSQKQYLGWSKQEVESLFDHTLPALGKIPGINAQKPILMGFSLGAEIALARYYHSAADIGGLIIDASYPLDFERSTMQHPVVHSSPPSGEGFKECPILVFVGQQDGFAKTWTLVLPAWLQAGVPLIVYHVPKYGHAFLLRGQQIPQLEDWITHVAAGEKPTTRPAEEMPTNPPATQNAAGH